VSWSFAYVILIFEPQIHLTLRWHYKPTSPSQVIVYLENMSEQIPLTLARFQSVTAQIYGNAIYLFKVKNGHLTQR